MESALLRHRPGTSRTSKLADSDLDSLRRVTGWIKTFIIEPDKELGRPGPVCPFVPGSLERKALWLAPEHMGNQSVTDLVQLVNDYNALLLRAQPSDADAKPAYADDGVVQGQFHERNEGSAVRNPDFHPFMAPAPFLLMRLAVTGDWVFFLDNPDGFNTWARRWGDSAVQASRRNYASPTGARAKRDNIAQTRVFPWREAAV
jgi:hypothetical protein